MSQTSVSASIVAYGNFEETADTIASVLRMTQGVDLTLYVIDNASPGNMGARLQKMFGEFCEIICLPKNVGFGKGHNAVLDKLDSLIHFVINPDIFLVNDVLAQITGYMLMHPDVAMVQPALKFPDGSDQYTAKRSPTFLGLLARQLPGRMLQKHEDKYLMRDKDLTRAQEVEFCSGCFFAVRTDAYKEIGGFDPGYFMYVEDADITRRMQPYGKSMYLPQFSVTHAWHRDARKKVKNFFWQVRSMFRYWRKWGFKWK